MAGFTLQDGTVFELDGVDVRIERTFDDGTVTLQYLRSSKFSQTSKSDLLAAYAAGKVVVVNTQTSTHSRSYTPHGRPLRDFPQAIQEIALRRKRYLEVLLNQGRPTFTPARLRPLIAAIAERLNDPNPPSPTTVYRWCSSMKETDDPRSLIPRFDARGPRQARTNPRVVELFMESLVEESKRTKAWSICDVETRLTGKLNHENHFRASGDLLDVPSRSTLYRLLDRVDEYDVTVLTEGKGAADKRFRITRIGERPTRILERVEIDHTPLDLFLVDEQTGIPCGRPTLTMLIDVYSRMPLGYYLSYNDTSTLAVMRALRHAILPKTPAAAVIPNLTVNHTWPCHGQFECLVSDNGSEFHSNSLEAACFDLQIRMLFCPARQPRFKGVIERYLKTINYCFVHKLPGTSLAKFADRGDYDPLNCAVLTIAEFTHVFEKWLLDCYAQTVHSGIGTTPWKRWADGERSFSPVLPPSVAELCTHLGVDCERSVRHDGIRLHGLQYVSDDLLPIMEAYGEGVRVRVTYDPDDIHFIHVRSPDSHDRIQVRALHADYAKGLRLVQHKLIQRHLKAQERSEEDPEALHQARLEIATAMSSAIFDKRLKKRRRAMKIAGISNENPTGTTIGVTNVPSAPRERTARIVPSSIQTYKRRQRRA